MTITFRGVPVLQPEQYAANVAYSTSLGLGGIPAGSGRLAVVGSAHSLPAYEETLRRWPGVAGDVYDPANTGTRQPGAIWAVNGGFRWCREHGIPAAFFSVHPTDSILPHLDLLQPGDHAILAQQSCPAVIDKALASGARVSLYGEREFPGAASATHAGFQGVTHGFIEATFFGCDLNFSDGKQHLNHDSGFRPLMVVTAAGEEYMTTPAYYSQALEIREIVKTFPSVFRERSAGMLRAMIEGPFHVTWLSPEILAAPDRGETVLSEEWESITVQTGSEPESVAASVPVASVPRPGEFFDIGCGVLVVTAEQLETVPLAAE